MLHKSVTLVTILTTFFPCNFGAEHSKAAKLGMIQEKHLLHILKLFLKNKSALDSL